MFGDIHNCGQVEGTKAALVGAYRQPTLMESLKEREKHFTGELEKIQSAIKALKAAPEACALLESLRKVSGLL